MKKKVLVIPDVHGSIFWKTCLNRIEEFDYIVQLGDWFDQWHNDWEKVDQIENLREFVELKKKYPDKIYLLIGNHDLGYLMNEGMSGQQKDKFQDIRHAMIEFASYMDIACKIDSCVYSHAGFSKTWMRKQGFKSIDEVNGAFHDSCYEPFRFNGWDSFGNDITQGPTWIRPYALISDMYFKKQVVGHTEFKDVPVLFKSRSDELIVVDSPSHEYQHIMGVKIQNIVTMPLYKVGDKVVFNANGETNTGIVEIVDVGGALGVNEHSYDIMVENPRCLWKHVPESNVKGFSKREV